MPQDDQFKINASYDERNLFHEGETLKVVLVSDHSETVHFERQSVLPADWIRDGALCWYQSSPGVDYRFAGVVDGRPRLLGGHTWVVKLRDMEFRYRNGERKTVPAAACDALAPREEQAP
jgi:hypothetical protein